MAQVQAPNGDVTYYTYDILDHPQWSEVDPGLLTAPPTGTVAPPVSETYGFDAADNLTYQSDFNMRAHQMSYDAANRLTTRTDQPSCGGCAIAAITTTLSADADGNVTQATRQEGTALPTTTTTQYNAADWTLNQDDGQGATYTAYDAAGRLVGQTLATSAGGLTPLGLAAGQGNVYDHAGRVTQTWDGARGATPLPPSSSRPPTASQRCARTWTTTRTGCSPYSQPLPWYWLTTRPYDPLLERFLRLDPSSWDGVRSCVYCHDDPMNDAGLSGPHEGDGEAGAGSVGTGEGGLPGSNDHSRG